MGLSGEDARQAAIALAGAPACLVVDRALPLRFSALGAQQRDLRPKVRQLAALGGLHFPRRRPRVPRRGCCARARSRRRWRAQGAVGRLSRRTSRRPLWCPLSAASGDGIGDEPDTARPDPLIADDHGDAHFRMAARLLRPFASSMRAEANTPAEPAGARVARFPADVSFPRFQGGSASASTISRPAQSSLALRPAWSLRTALGGSVFVPSALDDAVTSMIRSDRYRVERRLPGGIRTR